METVYAQIEYSLETVTISQEKYNGLLSYVKELEAQNQWLLEQLQVIRQKKFGASSEKASEEVVEQLSLLFDEAEVYVAEESKEEAPAVEVRSLTRKKGGDVRSIVPENIEVVETEHTLSEEEQTCPQCGETMQMIGKV